MTDEITIEGSQDYSLAIEEVTGTIRLENGAEFPWKAGEDLAMTIPVGGDLNADGRVDYTVTCDVATTFTNVSMALIQLKRYIQGGYFKGAIIPEAWTGLSPERIEFGPSTSIMYMIHA